ncbi:MAG: nuclear transport factor 2 family protein [Bacteroidota bacterium]
MTTQEIANQLVELCRQGKDDQAVDQLYHENVKSVEIQGWPKEVVNGIDNIRKKHKEFQSSVEEFHKNEVSDPLVAGNHFCCIMKLDATFKKMGRIQMEELCLYEVKDGKIVKEQFFYPPVPK